MLNDDGRLVHKPGENQCGLRMILSCELQLISAATGDRSCS